VYAFSYDRDHAEKRKLAWVASYSGGVEVNGINIFLAIFSPLLVHIL